MSPHQDESSDTQFPTNHCIVLQWPNLAEKASTPTKKQAKYTWLAENRTNVSMSIILRRDALTLHWAVPKFKPNMNQPNKNDLPIHSALVCRLSEPPVQEDELIMWASCPSSGAVRRGRTHQREHIGRYANGPGDIFPPGPPPRWKKRRNPSAGSAEMRATMSRFVSVQAVAGHDRKSRPEMHSVAENGYGAVGGGRWAVEVCIMYVVAVRWTVEVCIMYIVAVRWEGTYGERCGGRWPVGGNGGRRTVGRGRGWLVGTEAVDGGRWMMAGWQGRWTVDGGRWTVDGGRTT